MPFLPHTPEDIQEMLRTVRAESIEDLFRSIPEELRLRRPLKLPPRKTEAELLAAFRELESLNLRQGSRPCFLGAGSYLRFVPAAVDYLAGRGEFWTAYTPYQPEASQGTLQATFEYQSLMARLTAMEISNASMYEAGTALAEAVFMAYGIHGRGKRVLASEGIHPEYLRVLETYLARHPAHVERIPLRGWTTDPEALSALLERGEDVCAVAVQNPNFFGAIEDLGMLCQRAKESKSAPLFVSVVEPVSLAVLAPPGASGADIAVGDGQPLGNYPSYGGPTFGFFATKEAYVRRIPGRIVGETKDRDGKLGYVLTFQTREQHIRRERATSNICTNQALCALRAAIYLSLLGEEGLREVAEASARKARYAYNLLRTVPGVEPAEGAHFFFEFPIRLPIPAEEAYDRLAEKGITGGLPLSRLLRGRDREMLLAFTELTRREHIDRLADALEDVCSGARAGGRPERRERKPLPGSSGEHPIAPPVPSAEQGRNPAPPESEPPKAARGLPTIFDRSRPGRRGVLPPPAEPELPALGDLPGWALRRRPPGLPCLSELDVVRHYTLLSERNFAIDKNFYPLGSCTMKYNPRVNEVVAALPGFALAHPLSKSSEVQGLLRAFRALEEILAEVSGLPHVCLQPAAGAHGELTALLAIRAYHEERAPGRRKTVLVPDSAHGTNPSSCTIAGFEVREVRSGPDGRLDLDDLRSKIDDSVAAMMLTNPNTLGIFEARIREAADMLHAAGALLYMDGANMNALLGIARPGDFGVDIMHFNLHKTFSTPHGGGGPGAGPVAATDELEPYLPVPRIVENPDGSLELSEDRPRSIGKVRSFFGSSGVLLRALAYLWAHGPNDLRRVSECAVLNATYLRSLLEPAYHLPYSTPTLHEVVFSAKNQKAFGVKALDIAKRLIDLGFHPPTIYFPLIVPEALMIEPTETESKETLDAFAAALLQIAQEAERSPEILLRAPETTPVKRLDELTAVKRPVLVCPCS